MFIDICQIRKVCKCFQFFSLFINRTFFQISLCWYFKERYDSGFGLFRLGFGYFIEYRMPGIEIQFLWYKKQWLKKSSDDYARV